LVLHTRDSTLGGPVDVGIGHLDVLTAGHHDFIAGGNGTEVKVFKLLLSEGGELIDSHGIGLGSISVVGLDFGEVLFKDDAAVGFLL